MESVIKEDELNNILTPEIRSNLDQLTYDISGYYSFDEFDDLEKSIFGKYQLNGHEDTDGIHWILTAISLGEVIDFVRHGIGCYFLARVGIRYKMNYPSLCNNDITQENLDLLYGWIESVRMDRISNLKLDI